MDAKIFRIDFTRSSRARRTAADGHGAERMNGPRIFSLAAARERATARFIGDIFRGGNKYRGFVRIVKST